MRARGRDKASRKRIWWRSEVSPIPGNGTAKHVYTDRYGHGLFILLQAMVLFSPSL